MQDPADGTLSQLVRGVAEYDRYIGGGGSQPPDDSQPSASSASCAALLDELAEAGDPHHTQRRGLQSLDAEAYLSGGASQVHGQGYSQNYSQNYSQLHSQAQSQGGAAHPGRAAEEHASAAEALSVCGLGFGGLASSQLGELDDYEAPTFEEAENEMAEMGSGEGEVIELIVEELARLPSASERQRAAERIEVVVRAICGVVSVSVSESTGLVVVEACAAPRLRRSMPPPPMVGALVEALVEAQAGGSWLEDLEREVRREIGILGYQITSAGFVQTLEAQIEASQMEFRQIREQAWVEGEAEEAHALSPAAEPAIHVDAVERNEESNEEAVEEEEAADDDVDVWSQEVELLEVTDASQQHEPAWPDFSTGGGPGVGEARRREEEEVEERSYHREAVCDDVAGQEHEGLERQEEEQEKEQKEEQEGQEEGRTKSMDEDGNEEDVELREGGYARPFRKHIPQYDGSGDPEGMEDAVGGGEEEDHHNHHLGEAYGGYDHETLQFDDGDDSDSGDLAPTQQQQQQPLPLPQQVSSAAAASSSDGVGLGASDEESVDEDGNFGPTQPQPPPPVYGGARGQKRSRHVAFDTLPPIVLSPKGREPELVQQEEERNRQAGTGTAARLDSTAPGRSQHAYASSSSLGCPDGGVSAGAVSSVSVAPAQCTAPLDDPNASNTDGSRGGASSMASSSYWRAHASIEARGARETWRLSTALPTWRTMRWLTASAPASCPSMPPPHGLHGPCPRNTLASRRAAPA